MMDDIQEIIAREKIRQLAYQYALAVDAKDVNGLAELFVEDVDSGVYGVGREGIRMFYNQVLRAHRLTDCAIV